MHFNGILKVNCKKLMNFYDLVFNFVRWDDVIVLSKEYVSYRILNKHDLEPPCAPVQTINLSEMKAKCEELDIKCCKFSGNFDNDPFQGFFNLIELDLSGSNLSKFNSTIFQSLKKLERLDLAGKELTSLNPSWSRDLPSLQYLDLDGNQLILDSNIFKGFKSLKYLSLKYSKINSIHPDCFEDLESLSSLSLIGNQLSCLDSRVFKSLGNLKKLRLLDNEFTVIMPEVFEPLVNLEILCLDKYLLKSSVLKDAVGKYCENYYRECTIERADRIGDYYLGLKE